MADSVSAALHECQSKVDSGMKSLLNDLDNTVLRKLQVNLQRYLMVLILLSLVPSVEFGVCIWCVSTCYQRFVALCSNQNGRVSEKFSLFQLVVIIQF